MTDRHDDRHSTHQPVPIRPPAQPAHLVGWQTCRLETEDGQRLLARVSLPTMTRWPQVILWRGATWVYWGTYLKAAPDRSCPVYRYASSYVVVPDQAEIEAGLTRSTSR